MKALRRNKLIVAIAALGLVAAILAGAVGGYLAGTARATGIPSVEPLYYSGVLADTTGKLISGTKGIGVDPGGSIPEPIGGPRDGGLALGRREDQAGDGGDRGDYASKSA